jgi:histone H3/H4
MTITLDSNLQSNPTGPHIPPEGTENSRGNRDDDGIDPRRTVANHGTGRKSVATSHQSSRPLKRPSRQPFKNVFTLRKPASLKRPSTQGVALRRKRPGSNFHPPCRNYLMSARALWEIRKMQSDAMAEVVCCSIRPFQRLVREVTEKFHPGLRYERDALVALQLAAENFISMVFEMRHTYKSKQYTDVKVTSLPSMRSGSPLCQRTSNYYEIRGRISIHNIRLRS